MGYIRSVGALGYNQVSSFVFQSGYMFFHLLESFFHSFFVEERRFAQGLKIRIYVTKINEDLKFTERGMLRRMDKFKNFLNK